MCWRAGNTGFLILIKRILGVRALLNNQRKNRTRKNLRAARRFFLAGDFHEQPLDSRVRSFVAASSEPFLAAAASRSRA